jgi:hypothetical protein
MLKGDYYRYLYLALSDAAQLHCNPLSQIIALGGHSEITVQVNHYVMNLKVLK